MTQDDINTMECQ